LKKWLEKEGMAFDNTMMRNLVQHQIKELTRANLQEAAKMSDELKSIMEDFGLIDENGKETEEDDIPLIFYKLKTGVKVPPLPWKSEEQVSLYKISERKDWRDVAEKCKVPKENELYNSFKDERCTEVFKRVDKFLKGIEEMRKEGLGVYLHPSYYDEDGSLIPERINAFYVLFGFEGLKDSKCQASDLIEKCIANDVKIVKTTPASIFLAPDVKDLEGSYIRAVALLAADGDSENGGERVISESEMDQALESIRVVAESFKKAA
jgi:hypothetical protein